MDSFVDALVDDFMDVEAHRDHIEAQSDGALSPGSAIQIDQRR